MQVSAPAAGDLARLLQALLPLPDIETVRSAPSALPRIAEDHVILRYASVPQSSATSENLSPAPQDTSPVPKTAAPDPTLAAVALIPLVSDTRQIPVTHATIHASAAAVTAPNSAQGAIDVPAYIAPVPERPNRVCKIAGTDAARPRRFASMIRTLWSRAPLLLLLLSWFTAGLIVALITSAAFEWWGLGFLALIGFGFCMRVRHIRF